MLPREMSWTCRACKRSFGRCNQSHSCRPSGTADAYFEGRPPVQWKIYQAIVSYLRKVGPVQLDPVSVGVMIKRNRTFAEVRAKKDCIVLGMLLSRVVEDRRIAKILRLSTHRTAHAVELARVADFDAVVRSWLKEAFLDSPP